jgi:hypothetical protein
VDFELALFSTNAYSAEFYFGPAVHPLAMEEREAGCFPYRRQEDSVLCRGSCSPADNPGFFLGPASLGRQRLLLQKKSSGTISALVILFFTRLRRNKRV